MNKSRAFVGKRLIKICLTGLFTALVFVSTLAIRIPLPASGYVNFGDAVIFICGLLLGPIPAMISGAFGSMFADLVGFPIYAGFTFVIKGLEGLIVGLIAYKMFNKAPHKPLSIFFALLGTGVAFVEMMVGYFFTDWILYSLPAAVLTFAPSALQGGVSMAIALPLAIALQETALFTLGKYKQKRSASPNNDNTLPSSESGKEKIER